jgi:hypothetical protein
MRLIQMGGSWSDVLPQIALLVILSVGYHTLAHIRFTQLIRNPSLCPSEKTDVR